MEEYPAHIVLKLDTKEPIELGDFVSALTALASQYEKYIKETNPDLKGYARIYIREIRPGSIEADLIPWIVVAAPFIASMDHILIVENFVRVWGQRILGLLSDNAEEQFSNTSELKDWSDTVAVIANDPDGSATLEAATFEDKKKQIKATFKFDTPQARDIRKKLEHIKRGLEKTEQQEYIRVLMMFTRSDTGKAKVGKYTGERVKIEEISDASLPLVYGSELAEAQIKHEIRVSEENVYHKGFVVDVHVLTRNDKPAAYSVTHIHQVIDLPDTD
jgi:hypothetical protein